MTDGPLLSLQARMWRAMIGALVWLLFAVLLLWFSIDIDPGTIDNGTPMGPYKATFLKIVGGVMALGFSGLAFLYLRVLIIRPRVCVDLSAIQYESRLGRRTVRVESIAEVRIVCWHNKMNFKLMDIRCFDKEGRRLSPWFYGLCSGMDQKQVIAALKPLVASCPNLRVTEQGGARS